MENLPKSKYHPLNLAEFQELKGHLNGIRSHLPPHLMNPFWRWCNIIRNENVRQPCSCNSAAGHWARCVNDLRKWVEDKDGLAKGE
jgi:hypothetical protein